jgi:diguanylate cyclase
MSRAPLRPEPVLPARDPETGLANRALLQEIMAPLLALGRRNARGLAVLHLRVKGAASVVLEAADIIGELTRDCDVAARVAEDEFVVALSEIWEADAAVRVAHRLRSGLQAGGRRATQSAIGVAFFPPDGNDPSALLSAAERATPSSPGIGFANRRLGRDALLRAGLLRDLESPRTMSQFDMHYQPIRALETGEVVGAESLLRWNRSGVLLPAGDFIDVAERSGRIRAIDRWSIERSMRDLVEWRSHGWDGWLSMNLSGLSVADTGLPLTVQQLLDGTGASPHSLVFEVTERSSLTGDRVGAGVLDRLRDMGARVAVDDFGTGYASFEYLRDFDPDLVKLDRTFVAGAPGAAADRLLPALVDLAHRLGKPVVAEGVEDLGELKRSIDCTCEMAQGYFLGRPMPADEFLEAHVLAA